MIISEKQIMQLLRQLNDHVDLLARINASNPDYIIYLRELYTEIQNQQSDKPVEIPDEVSQ